MASGKASGKARGDSEKGEQKKNKNINKIIKVTQVELHRKRLLARGSHHKSLMEADADRY